MRWSWKIARIAGIDVYVHATFLILVAWVGAAHWLAEHSLAAAVTGVLFILALFACVVFHELGHALTARRYGVRTRNITLWPIGGIASLERIPDEPRQEAAVAIAGPLVNVAIAAVLWGVLQLTGDTTALSEGNLGEASFLERLLAVNLFLALFNLLPAFPMDGGRVLRALLATRMSHVRATEIAAQIGQGMALVFGLLGLFTNPFLVFIAFFVYLGAYGEAAVSQMQAAFRGIPVSRAMLTDFEVLHPRDPLARAVALTLAGTQVDFPVIDESGGVLGVLRQAELLAGLAGQGPEAPVEGWMCRDIQVVDPHALLDGVFMQVQQSACRTLPVVHRGRLVGLLTPQNLGEFIQIESALAASRPRRR